MSRLETWIDRIVRMKNLATSLVTAIVDDGSETMPDIGEPTPLRADPTTGAILVKDVSGGGGGGGGGATEATLSELNDKVTTATDTPTGTDPGVVVRLVQSGPILTSVQNQAFAGAIPGPSDSGQLVRVIPTDAVTADQCVGVVLATNHQTITTSGRAFAAGRDKGSTLQGDVTSTDFSADRQLLDVGVYQTVLPPDAATESGLTTIAGGIDTTNVSLSGIATAQTDGTQKTQITNGTDSAGVLASAPTGTEQGLVVRPIPSGTQAVSGPLTDTQLRASPVPVGDGGGSLTVDGAVTATISGTPSVTVASGAITETNSSTIATNTGRIPAQGQALASASTPVVLPLSQAAGALALQAQFPAALGAGGGVKVDGSGTPLPVNGTVTANVGTTNGLALDATLTGGTQIAIAKGPVSPGAAVGAEKPVLVGGSDGTNARTLATDSTGRAAVAGNVAIGGTAPLPITVGGVDTSGNTYPLQGQIAGSAIHLFVRQGGGVNWTCDTELPAAAALSSNTSNPTVPSVGSFPHHWDPSNALWQRSHGLPNGSQVVAFDRAHLGPFGHLIAQPLVFISQIAFTYGINTQTGTTGTSGTGATVDTSSGMLRVQSGTASSTSASFLSYRPLLYRAAQGMGMCWSCAFTTGLANNTSIAGPSTDATNADGYFFGYKGTSFGIHHYRSGSEVSFAAQASWNGTIPTGFDPTKLNVYEVRYPFLGAGDVFFFVQDSSTGRPYLVHTIRYANTSTLLEISNPTMRFLARSTNNGNTTNLTMLVGSIGAYVVGDRHFNGPFFAYNNQKSVTGGTETNIFSVRVATTINGVTNRGAARIRLATAVSDNGNTITAFFARLNATLGGTPAFAAYNGSTADNGVTLTGANSMLSFDTAGTTVTGASTTVAVNTGCARNSQVPFDFSDLDIILLPGETWTVSALPGANSNCAVFFNGLEEW